MKNGLLPRTKDKRDYSYFRTFHKDILANPVLGSAVLASIPDEFDFDVHLTMPDQNADGLYNACTAYAQSDIYTDETKKVVSPKDLYAKTMEVMGIKPTDPKYLRVACDIRSALKAAKLLYNFPSYFDILDGAPFDTFDTIRMVLYSQKRTASIGTPWLKEWEHPQNGIITETFLFDDSASWHDYKFTGTKKIDGVIYLVAKSWQGPNFGSGGLVYFPRSVVNKSFGVKGTFAYTFAPPPTDPGDVVTVAGFWENLFTSILNFIKSLTPQPVPPIDVPEPVPIAETSVESPQPVTIEPAEQTLLWDTKVNSRHSCRVVMDEYHLGWNEKDTLCAVLEAESNFNINAMNYNKDKAGKVWSVDAGIAQINDYYNIGPGKYFASVDEVLANPAKSVRFMVEMYQQGHLTMWSSVKSGAYKKFLPA